MKFGSNLLPLSLACACAPPFAEATSVFIFYNYKTIENFKDDSYGLQGELVIPRRRLWLSLALLLLAHIRVGILAW